jgi:hypothetical protein
MTPNFLLVQVPTPDFNKLLTVSQQALGYNAAEAVDSNPVIRTDAERFLSCLAAMQDQHAQPGFASHLLNHVAFSVLVAADERDMLAIVEIGQMPFVVVDTCARGVQLAVMSGTLAQWKLVGERIPRVRDVFIEGGIDVWKADLLRLT